MANWAYNDWREQPTAALQLERLNLHISEVSDRVSETASSEGQSIDTKTILEYLKYLSAQADKLQNRVDQATGARGPAFIRGRA